MINKLSDKLNITLLSWFGLSLYKPSDAFPRNVENYPGLEETIRWMLYGLARWLSRLRHMLLNLTT